MGVSIEIGKWCGRRRWPCDQYNIMKNNKAQLKTKRHTKLTYLVTNLIPLLKNLRLKRPNQNQLLSLFLSWRNNNEKRQNQIQHKRIQGEHPAGAHCFRSNGQTIATTHTKPGSQLSARLCIPDSMADPWVKVIRLSGMPSPKQQTVLLGERKGFFVFLVFRRSLSPLLCIFNWIMFLWGNFNTTKNGFRYRCSEKCVCRISFCNYQDK